MVFVKEKSDGACALKNASYDTKEMIEMSSFVKDLQYFFKMTFMGS